MEVEDATTQSIPIETEEAEGTEVKELEQAMERKRRRKLGSKEKGKGKERAKDSLPAGDTLPAKNKMQDDWQCSMREGFLHMRTHQITRRRWR